MSDYSNKSLAEFREHQKRELAKKTGFKKGYSLEFSSIENINTPMYMQGYESGQVKRAREIQEQMVNLYKINLFKTK